MDMDFAAAMRAATRLTRAQKLLDATRLIQNALLVGGGQAPAEPQQDSAAAGQFSELKFIDVTPEAASSEVAAPAVCSSAHGSMRDLAASLQAKLRGFRPGAMPVRARKPIEIPDGAQFLSRSYANAAGSRSYKLYIPSAARSGKRPLLIMLHGGTQDAEDFAVGTRMNALAEDHGLIVAYPNQCKIANASLCWNWFHPEHQSQGTGEPSIIAGITEEIVAEYDIDPDRVFVAGLSAGGAMAAVLGATYPELFAAIGVHSGLPYKSANDVASAFVAMRGDPAPRRRVKRKPRPAAKDAPRVRTIVFHGDADRIVHPSNAARIVDAHARTGDSVERKKERASSSRAYTREVARDEAGAAALERWLIHGSGHAWSGGSPDGTFTDPQGPDASREMLRFFLDERSRRD